MTNAPRDVSLFVILAMAPGLPAVPPTATTNVLVPLSAAFLTNVVTAGVGRPSQTGVMMTTCASGSIL